MIPRSPRYIPWTGRYGKRLAGLTRCCDRDGAVGFAVQGGGDGMHHRGDAHRRLDLLGGKPGLAQDFFMAVDADAAAIDRRHRQAPELEVHLVHARLADHVHAQPRRRGLVVRRRRQMGEAVIDVVHRHDGGRGLGGVKRLGRKLRRKACHHRFGGRRIARGQRAGDEGAGALLLGEHRLGRQGREVQLQVLGIVGQRVFQGFDAHGFVLSWSRREPAPLGRGAGECRARGVRVAPRGARVRAGRVYAAVLMTSSPFCQLQGQSSSVCSASSTRSTSCGFRPTLMSVT